MKSVVIHCSLALSQCFTSSIKVFYFIYQQHNVLQFKNQFISPWHSSSSGQRDSCSLSAPEQRRGRTLQGRLSSETCRVGYSEILGSPHPKNTQQNHLVAEKWRVKSKNWLKAGEHWVNLCYFASAEVGKPLQWDGQDIRGPMDCETFGRWHFLFAPERGLKKSHITLNEFKLICRIPAKALTWRTCRRSHHWARLVSQTIPRLAQCLLLAVTQRMEITTH